MDRTSYSMAESSELNGVKYLKSHAQVLLNRTGAPNSALFIAQDYLTHLHNLCANRCLNWKKPEQVSRGDTRYFPPADALLL